jgi:IPT/TIG domain-containing protein
LATSPSLTLMAPTPGHAAGGTTVTLAGAALTGATAVHFGASLAAYTLVSDSQINAVAPVGSGTVTVNVTTGSGTSNSLSHTYIPAPTITSIAPSQGPLPGGSSVTLTGTGFTGRHGGDVRVHVASSFTVSDSTHINATAPGGNLPGPVQVTVTAPGGTSNGVSYFYIPAPQSRRSRRIRSRRPAVTPPR